MVPLVVRLDPPAVGLTPVRPMLAADAAPANRAATSFGSPHVYRRDAAPQRSGIAEIEMQQIAGARTLQGEWSIISLACVQK